MLLLSYYTQQFDGLNQIFCRVTCNETLTVPNVKILQLAFFMTSPERLAYVCQWTYHCRLHVCLGATL